LAVFWLAWLVLAGATVEAVAAGENAGAFAAKPKAPTEDSDDPLHFSRNSRPEFYGKDHPHVSYKGFTLIGALNIKHGVPGNEKFLPNSSKPSN
jgi:hypothetical protein